MSFNDILILDIDKIDSIEINKATVKPTKHRQHVSVRI